MPIAAATALEGQSLLALAFGAGVASSLSPCVVALLPVLVGYIGAYTQESKAALWRPLVLFILGFALVLTLFGLLAGGFGIMMTTLLGRWWSFLMGLLAVLMGLQLSGCLKLPLPQLQSAIPQSARVSAGWLAPLVLGSFFAAASSPCATPFLTAILAFASQQRHWAMAALALFCYALGQSALLLAAGFCTGLLKQMALLRRVGSVVVKLSAGVFLLAGLRLLALSLGWFDPLAFYP